MIVVDSLASAAMTGSLLAEIRRVTDKPIRFLVNTHSHADHVYTNHLFPDATVVSSRPARERTRARGSRPGTTRSWPSSSRTWTSAAGATRRWT